MNQKNEVYYSLLPIRSNYRRMKFFSFTTKPSSLLILHIGDFLPEVIF